MRVSGFEIDRSPEDVAPWQPGPFNRPPRPPSPGGKGEERSHLDGLAFGTDRPETARESHEGVQMARVVHAMRLRLLLLSLPGVGAIALGGGDATAGGV